MTNALNTLPNGSGSPLFPYRSGVKSRCAQADAGYSLSDFPIGAFVRSLSSRLWGLSIREWTVSAVRNNVGECPILLYSALY